MFNPKVCTLVKGEDRPFSRSENIARTQEISKRHKNLVQSTLR